MDGRKDTAVEALLEHLIEHGTAAAGWPWIPVVIATPSSARDPACEAVSSGTRPSS